MTKLDSLIQLHEAMMADDVYRNECALNERARQREEHKARLEEIESIVGDMPLDRLRAICEAERKTYATGGVIAWDELKKIHEKKTYEE